MQEMISSLHLSTALIYDVLRQWSLYLNRYVVVFVSKKMEAPGSNISFLLDPILVELEGGRYVVPILPGPLAELFARRRISVGGGNCVQRG